MNVFRFLALLLILAAASDKGMGVDPNGRPFGVSSDGGPGMDPNG